MSLRERLLASRQGVPGDDPLAVIQGRLHRQVVARLGEEAGPGALPGAPGDPAELRSRVEGLVHELIERDYPELAPGERQRVVAGVCDDVFGFGPITALLREPDVTEIMVNGPHAVYAERQGRIEKAAVAFRDAEHVMAVVERILAPLGRRVDEACPMVDARLPDGSRVNVIIPPICLQGPAVTIRKFGENPLGPEDLIALGALTWEMGRFLQCCVESRRSILVCGGTATGKTTMLNALSTFIPAEERIITIEDAAELKLRQGHVVSLEARPPNLEGRGAVTVRDLVRNALRMRPDRIVIGEVRGGEALDLLQAMNTGHEGSLATLHANSPRDALARLETMALMAGLDLPARAIREQIAAALHIIVHLERYEDGTRRVARIAEVQGMEGPVITLHDVFAFERTGVDRGGRVRGRFLRSAARPAAVEVFRRFGLDCDLWGMPADGEAGR